MRVETVTTTKKRGLVVRWVAVDGGVVGGVADDEEWGEWDRSYHYYLHHYCLLRCRS